MAIVCIDTQILYWAIRKVEPPNNPELVPQASDFIRWIDEQNYQVILPTIVLGEILVATPNEEHISLLTTLRRDWRIVDFDIPSAQKFAELRRDHIIKNRIKNLRDPNQYATRAALKADVMIIATCIVHGATRIYTYDNNFIKMAEGFIEAKKFTEENYQLSMNFPEDDID